jgi:hypothetical protein
MGPFYAAETKRPRTEPSVNWNHRDGPYLLMTDGGYHWLTLWNGFNFGSI